MNRTKIIATVKSQEEDKVPFSLKLPASLKEEIQTLAEKESISMNSLVVATLQSLINDDCGRELDSLSTKLNLATEIISYVEDFVVVPDEELQQMFSTTGQSASQIPIIEKHHTDRLKLNANIAKFLKKD
ncbi:MAG: hypothetical protein OEL19_08220 [Sulfurimonas sp.]|nr:hypothetical protein [Sulfurimonas sp.]